MSHSRGTKVGLIFQVAGAPFELRGVLEKADDELVILIPETENLPVQRAQTEVRVPEILGSLLLLVSPEE